MNELELASSKSLASEIVEITRDNWMGGEHVVVWFPNGFGGSVIRNRMSCGGRDGLWELAVVGRYPDGTEYGPTVDWTPITNDVIGWLTGDEVIEKLTEISRLPLFPAAKELKELS